VSVLGKLPAAAAAFAAFAGSAHAAPLSYRCDSGPGRYSQLKQIEPGPSYRASGRISANELGKHKHWAPGGSIVVESADKQTSAALKLAAPAWRAPLDVLLQIRKGETLETQALGQIGLGQELSFVMTVADGRVQVEIGAMRGEASIALGAGASVGVGCSTGNFQFEDLRLGEAGR
jgi:hypothetical protein